VAGPIRPRLAAAARKAIGGQEPTRAERGSRCSDDRSTSTPRPCRASTPVCSPRWPRRGRNAQTPGRRGQRPAGGSGFPSRRGHLARRDAGGWRRRAPPRIRPQDAPGAEQSRGPAQADSHPDPAGRRPQHQRPVTPGAADPGLAFVSAQADGVIRPVVRRPGSAVVRLASRPAGLLRRRRARPPPGRGYAVLPGHLGPRGSSVTDARAVLPVGTSGTPARSCAGSPRPARRPRQTRE